MVTIAHEISVDAKALRTDVVDDERETVTLPRAATLRAGFTYIVKWMKCAMDRQSGAGGSVVPNIYYYLPPDVDALVEDLKQTKYCVFCGARQSGNSTSVMAAKEKLRIESNACMVYLGGLISAKASWDGSKLWGYFWDKNPNKICSEVQFRRLFAKDKLLNAVTVFLDEADTLLNLSMSFSM
ncbi:hypothetical protein L7F22_025981 [Adiantum nelumboides]|nr:hypothetical protein [Adiantum nelumboides]